METQTPHLYTTHSLFNKVKTILTDLVPKNAGQSFQVLDVPAGGGALSQFLNETLGVRVSAAEYDVSKWTYSPVKCVFADLSDRLPFDDNTFDIAVCLEGIKHVPNAQKALAELRRVTKPGGQVILTIPNDLCMQARLRYLFDGFVDVDWKHPMVIGSDNDKSFFYVSSLLSLPYIWFYIEKQGLNIRFTAHNRLRGASVLLAIILYPLIWRYTGKAAKNNPRLRKEMLSMTWLAGRHNIIVCDKPKG